MTRLNLRQLARWLTPLIAAAIAFLSLSPADPDSSGGFALLEAIARWLLGDPEQQDKVGHFLAYGALSGSAGFGLTSVSKWMLFGAALLYGGVFELLQAGLPGRYASWADMVANGSGAAAGLLGAILLSRLLKA